MSNQIPIFIKEFFYSQGGFFRDDPELQTYCLLIEGGRDKRHLVDIIYNYLVNEISNRKGSYQEIEFNRIYVQTLTQDLVDKIKKEEEFIFVHMPNRLNSSLLPKEIRQKIYRIDLKDFKIKPDFKNPHFL